MLRIIMVMCIAYVAHNKCQQQPRDVHEIEALDIFNMDVPINEYSPRGKRQEDLLAMLAKLNIPDKLDVPEENKPRVKRQEEDDWAAPFCGETAPRLNFNLEKAYGDWYPVLASKMAFQLWMTSLYGEDGTVGFMCPTWNLQQGKEINTINIQVTHQRKSIVVEVFLLGEGVNSKASKWVVIWPNDEDTLTSVVAIGGNGGNEGNYEWMLTMDCDLNGVVSSDWAVCSRNPTMSEENLTAIKAIAHGIQGLQTKDMTRTGPHKTCRWVPVGNSYGDTRWENVRITHYTFP